MKHTFLQITGFAGGIFFLTACGGAASEADLNSSNSSMTVVDTAVQPSAVEENTATVIEKEEELLAENFEEKETEESSEFIKTELNDVVLSRKMPDQTKTLRVDGFADTNGSGDVYRSGWGDEGSGSGAGSGNNTVPREVISKPEIKNPTQEDGTVSVELLIDREGKVVKATVMSSGGKTTTHNEELLKAARQYALQYRFNEVDSGPETVKQIIHIAFKL
jgi:hypothetical protein